MQDMPWHMERYKKEKGSLQKRTQTSFLQHPTSFPVDRSKSNPPELLAKRNVMRTPLSYLQIKEIWAKKKDISSEGHLVEYGDDLPLVYLKYAIKPCSVSITKSDSQMIKCTFSQNFTPKIDNFIRQYLK